MSPDGKKRARSGSHDEGEVQDLRPHKRKVKSCESCRRLKTRCEARGDGISCHRCEILKLHCSFGSARDPLSPSPPLSPEPSEPRSGTSNLLEKRLRALETSLTEIKSMLKDRPVVLSDDMNLERSLRDIGNEISTDVAAVKQSRIPKDTGSHLTDQNSRAAPMRLIWDMNEHILGSETIGNDSDTSADVVTVGIITEDLASKFLAGFSQISRRWLFMRVNPMAIRQKSPLLFGTCVLAGLQIESNLHGSELHQALYQHVNTLLNRKTLLSPLSLETIQAMFICAMWNLLPSNDNLRMDPWVLSGLAAMHATISINFDQLTAPQKDGRVDPRARETLRTFNLICLCHLQFSVGTGRPPVISNQHLDQCSAILSFPSYNSRDQLVALGVKLYSSLSNLINSDVVQTNDLSWQEIDDWKKSCGDFYDQEGSKPLKFAFSCSYLILTRRTLKYLSDQPDISLRSSTTAKNLDSSAYIQLSVQHAHKILNSFLEMSELSSFVRPAYENLLCSFAMVTLSEFATYLDDPKETLDLMEKTSYHIQLGGRAEPVARWALNVLRKHCLDSRRAEEADREHGVASVGRHDQTEIETLDPIVEDGVEYDQQWSTPWISRDDFVSLEDMFLNI